MKLCVAQEPGTEEAGTGQDWALGKPPRQQELAPQDVYSEGPLQENTLDLKKRDIFQCLSSSLYCQSHVPTAEEESVKGPSVLTEQAMKGE